MRFIAVTANAPDFDELLKDLTKDVDDTVDEIDIEYAKTYKTWTHEPNFKKKRAKIIGGRLIGSTAIYERVSKDNPYQFIEKGTKVRYATMTPNFKAKTVPGVVGSQTGSGGVLFISKRRPRPGIKKRDFTTVIKDNQQPKFTKRVEDTIDKFSKKSAKD